MTGLELGLRVAHRVTLASSTRSPHRAACRSNPATARSFKTRRPMSAAATVRAAPATRQPRRQTPGRRPPSVADWLKPGPARPRSRSGNLNSAPAAPSLIG
jgi:hypothetical protein